VAHEEEMMQAYSKRSEVPVSKSELFAWHKRPGAFERLTPPWEDVRVVDRTGGITSGSRVTLVNRFGPLAQRWTVEHRDYVEGERFRDLQIEGPFAHWLHTHAFHGTTDGTSYLEDRISYRLPLGKLGACVAEKVVERKLERMFRYRHETTIRDLELHRHYRGAEAMKVLVTGASGLIGSALLPLLTTGGHTAVGLVRKGSASADSDSWWDPGTGEVSEAALQGTSAVVHLAGESIADGRWTAARKAAIRESRVAGTRKLAEFLAQSPRRPDVFVCASAIGYYGDRGDTVLGEEDEAGEGFLSEVCRAWEAATRPLAEAGTRVVHVRTGIVLSPAGGALGKMLTPFKLGAGGVIGSGKQYMSWIGIDDLVGIFYHALNTDSLSGPLNATAPHPVTNREFTKTLGRVLGRPTVAPLPAFAARLAFGEMADELLLSSARVEPKKALATGYTFRHADLEANLRHLLGR
jgi:uncharacterized protein (TIGR01777 family)